MFLLWALISSMKCITCTLSLWQSSLWFLSKQLHTYKQAILSIINEWMHAVSKVSKKDKFILFKFYKVFSF